MSARRVLLRFIDHLRSAGFKVSPAETRDALEVLELVGYSDKLRLRTALSSVLAKSVRDKGLFNQIFIAFFALEGRMSALPALESGILAENLSDLSKILLTGDAADLALRIQDRLDQLDFSRLTAPSQRGAMIREVLENLDWDQIASDITRLQGLPGGAFSAQAGALEQRSRALLATVTTAINAGVRQHFSYRNCEPSDEILTNRSLFRIDDGDRPRLLALLRTLIQRLQTRYARRRRQARRGRLDFKATIRRNVGNQGLLFDLRWTRKRIRRPELVVLCDLSRSVYHVSTFFLLLLYSLHEIIPRIRIFAFCSNLLEVTDLFSHWDPDQVARNLDDRSKFPLHWGLTDYGRAFRQFEQNWPGLVTSRTTFLVLGDARNNRDDPATEVVARIRERAHRLLWLNPEPKTLWGTGDSEMLGYLPHCHTARVCNCLRHLEQVIEDLAES